MKISINPERFIGFIFLISSFINYVAGNLNAAIYTAIISVAFYASTKGNN